MGTRFRVLAAVMAGLTLAGCGETDTSGVPASIVVFDGTGQTGAPGAQLPEPLQAQVLTDDGEPTPDIQVRWEVGSGGGSVSPVTSVTDASGVASTTYTLGNLEGEQTVTASVPGIAIEGATFTLTAEEDGGGGQQISRR